MPLILKHLGKACEEAGPHLEDVHCYHFLLPLWHLVQQMELFCGWLYFPWGHRLSLLSRSPRLGTSPVTPEEYISTNRARSTWGRIRQRTAIRRGEAGVSQEASQNLPRSSPSSVGCSPPATATHAPSSSSKPRQLALGDLVLNSLAVLCAHFCPSSLRPVDLRSWLYFILISP